MPGGHFSAETDAYGDKIIGKDRLRHAVQGFRPGVRRLRGAAERGTAAGHADTARVSIPAPGSFAAFDGAQIAAFTLNGIGNFNGVPTAYDTGTGTLKEYRGTGLGTEIFRHSMPHLRRAGVGQYLLEVLQYNTRAVSVYRNLGFETVREFNYFCRANTEIADRGDTPRLPHSVRRTDPEKFASISSFWDFTLSWQNSFESIGRAAGDFVSLGVFTEEELAGYCVFEPASGDVAQIAVKRQYRRKGIAGLLLREMLRLNRNDSLKIINTDVSCDSMTGFLQAKNIVPQGKQFEMIRKI